MKYPGMRVLSMPLTSFNLASGCSMRNDAAKGSAMRCRAACIYNVVSTYADFGGGVALCSVGMSTVSVGRRSNTTLVMLSSSPMAAEEREVLHTHHKPQHRHTCSYYYSLVH